MKQFHLTNSTHVSHRHQHSPVSKAAAPLEEAACSLFHADGLICTQRWGGGVGGRINIIDEYQMYRPELYIWCTPLICRRPYFPFSLITFSAQSLFQHPALLAGTAVLSPMRMCGPQKCTRGLRRADTVAKVVRAGDDDRISRGKYDCFGLDCQGWLSAPALRRRSEPPRWPLSPVSRELTSRNYSGWHIAARAR